MRQSARDSILSLPRNGNFSNRSSAMYSMSEDSQTPMMAHAATKASGLRQEYYDDTGDYDEGLMMPQGERRHDGKF
jgi:hypothetical protein